MSLTQTEVVDYIKNMKLGEVRGLVDELEDELGVEATPPLIPFPFPDYWEGDVEQTEFDVVLTSYGNGKIKVIKAVRQATGLGLREAKTMVESAPVPIREALDKTGAEELKAALEEAGGTVEIV